jgi:ArsR family transcriptional regulator, virulence genes transcriptional regulator
MPSPDGPGAVAPAAMAEAAGRAARLLRLMGHDGRLMVLCHLAEREQTVGCLERKLGLSQSALSQHLAKLRLDGLVATRREGQQIHYRLASTEVARILHALQEVYCPSPEA